MQLPGFKIASGVATLFAIFFTIGLTDRANAKAFAGVHQAVWHSYVDVQCSLEGDCDSGLPPGISFTCFGDASGNETRCDMYSSLTITNEGATLKTQTLTITGGFRITNTTADVVPYHMDILISFGEFNPGGSIFGALIDVPGVEYAGFSSSILGDAAGGTLACDTNGYKLDSEFTTPTSCGVYTPDESSDYLQFGPFDPYESIEETYTITITASARGTPEPPTIFLTGAILMIFGFSRRMKQIEQ